MIYIEIYLALKLFEANIAINNGLHRNTTFGETLIIESKTKRNDYLIPNDVL